MTGPGQRLIAFYVPQFIAGGVQRTTMTLAEGLLNHGFAVDLLYIEGSDFCAEILSGVHQVKLVAKSIVRSIPAIMHYMRHEQPDVFISSMPQVNVISTIAHALSRRRHVRLLLTEVSHFTSWQRYFPKAKLTLVKWLMKLTYPRADHIVSVARAIDTDLKSFIKLDPRRTHVIHSPVDQCTIATRALATMTHRWIGVSGIEAIVTLCRLDPVKDIPTLVAAFREVHRQRPQARLVIIGQGSDRMRVEDAVRSHGLADAVELTGYVADPYPIIARARVFVLSSRIEGFPTVLVEALSLGIPVVSTNCDSGPSDILADGAWGELVPVGDVDALAAALIRTLAGSRWSTAELRARAGAFTLQAALDRYLPLLS